MISKELEGTLNAALKEAKSRRHEYVCLEHLLYALLQDKDASGAIINCGGDIDRLRKGLEAFFQTHLEALPGGSDRRRCARPGRRRWRNAGSSRTFHPRC